MTAGRIATRSPGCYGAALGIVAGITCFGYGLVTAFDEASALPFALAFAVGGFLDAALCFFAVRCSRAAWSFAIALNGTACLIFLFGAPQVRDGLEIPGAAALLPCLVFAAAAVLLGWAGRDYEVE